MTKEDKEIHKHTSVDGEKFTVEEIGTLFGCRIFVESDNPEMLEVIREELVKFFNREKPLPDWMN